MIEIVDALDRVIGLESPAKRVVSLVPSETESVVALTGAERLIGRTEYCIEPADAVGSVPALGGTKNAAVDRIVELRPDLVLCNKEENSRRDIERLIDAGLPVHVSFPCTLEESDRYLQALAQMLGCSVDARALSGSVASEEVSAQPPLRVFVPIWLDPLMTFDGRTFASDMVQRAGGRNVFYDRHRRYPLAADIGNADPKEPGERDTRYPRISREELSSKSPELVLLPNEPYPFTHADVAFFEKCCPHAKVILADGRDLFWYGWRARAAVSRLASIIDSARQG